MSSEVSIRSYPQVFIRTDASSTIGFGHLMRMLVLADELRKSSFDVSFVIQNNKHAINFVENKGYSYLLVSGVSSFVDELLLDELTQIPESIKKGKSIFIVDHPGAGSRYLEELSVFSSYLMVMAVDGLKERFYPCDIVLNQNYMANAGDIRAKIGAVKLVGLEYTLLRDDFIAFRQDLYSKSSVRNIMVCFGGSDVANQTLRFARIFLSKHDEIFRNITINFIVGPSFSNLEELKVICGSGFSMNVFCQPENIEEMMSSADMVITAAGSMCWEFAYLGVPGLLLVTSDNQRRIAEQLDHDNYYTNLGFYADISDHDIHERLRTFIDNYPLLDSNREALCRLVDGQGKVRVVKNIVELVSGD